MAMSLAIRRVSRETSLHAQRFPLYLRRETHRAVTERILHDVTKLILVNAGTTTLIYEAGELILREGDIVLLPPGCWYVGKPSSLVVTTTAYIDTTFLHEQAHWLDARDVPDLFSSTDVRRPVPVHLPSAALSRLHDVFRVLLESQRRADPAFHRLSHVAQLLGILAQQNTVGPLEHDAVRRAMTALLEHLDAPWSIDALSQTVAMSPSQLSRLFRQHLQMGPAEFLRRERARRMAVLLLSSTDSVEAIARQVGLAGPSHASRTFREIHQLSPQQYRRAHRGSWMR